MRRLLCIGGLLLCAASIAAAPAASDFDREFVEHWERGTLFRYATAKRFSEAGWGARYQEAVSRMPESPVDGLSLEIKVSHSEPPTLGKPLSLDFWLINRSKRDVSLPVRASCRTVHAVRVIVLDSEENSHEWIGRGLDGGPHCFCKQINEVIRPTARVELSTTITDELRVATWSPRKPGKHVVLGQYTLPGAPEKRLISKPLTIDVQAE